MDKKKAFGIFLRGIIMGAADVVPGVSGGTIAFISGIYEELLNSIKAVKPSLIQVLFKDGIKAFWTAINGNFLLPLFFGIAVSILSLAKGISFVLANYPILIWSFFFGLIVASTIYIGKQITKWTWQVILMLIIGVVIAYGITILAPAQAELSYFNVFGAGFIAICAMILPGISGSFILLLMGMYGHVINALKTFDLAIIAVFGIGCVCGLLSIANLLSWLFKNYKSIVLGLLTGFMIGSLNKVWPWKETIETRINSHGEEVPFLQENILPMNYESIVGEPSQLLFAIVMAILGFAVVFGIEYIAEKTKPAV